MTVKTSTDNFAGSVSYLQKHRYSNQVTLKKLIFGCFKIGIVSRDFIIKNLKHIIENGVSYLHAPFSCVIGKTQ